MIPARQQPLSRPASVLVLLLGSAFIAAGCADEDLVAPDRQEVAELRAVTANGPPNPRGVSTETADIIDQGEDVMTGSVLVEDGATLRRTPNGISVRVSMPTPAPGTYDYPEGTEEGHPEAFTLWVFVFNDPEAAGPDGAFLGGGHVVGGPHLDLSGHISKKTEPFVAFVDDGLLENPAEAKVLLRVAPHGAQDPDRLPEQIKVPSGDPSFWWSAVFE